ncbi:Integrase, catalytic core [Gossypium australe]|uniref:Integrase, catalytic core n=1 Tax=Gossypium australe TaxID=47621 RepID=A0A5B6WHT2_9ROSI|nr:Integrase, catalytic core [Gossypium australe]
MEALLKEYMAKNDAIIQCQAASLKTLENQVGQIAKALSSRSQGELSGTQLPGVVNDTTIKEGSSNFTNKKNSKQVVEQATKENSKKKNVELDSSCISNKNSITEQPQQMEERPPPPFPQKIHRCPKAISYQHMVGSIGTNAQLCKIHERYLIKEEKVGEFEIDALTDGCTTMLLKQIATKAKGSREFYYTFLYWKSLCRQNIMRLRCKYKSNAMSIFKKLGIGKARPTTVTLQLANRSYAHPEECEADKEVPIILGKPFLATSRTLIGVRKGELTMRIKDQKITFNVFDATKCADIDDECHVVDIVNTIAQEEFVEFYHNNSNDDANSFELIEA